MSFYRELLWVKTLSKTLWWKEMYTSVNPGLELQFPTGKSVIQPRLSSDIIDKRAVRRTLSWFIFLAHTHTHHFHIRTSMRVLDLFWISLRSSIEIHYSQVQEELLFNMLYTYGLMCCQKGTPPTKSAPSFIKMLLLLLTCLNQFVCCLTLHGQLWQNIIDWVTDTTDFYFLRSGGWTSKIRVLANSVPGEDSLLVWLRERERERDSVFPSSLVFP